MRPITSSIDGAETSSAEDGMSGPTPMPSRQLVAGAAYLASTLSAQVCHRQKLHAILGLSGVSKPCIACKSFLTMPFGQW